ncbi:MAG: hypothetical protein AAF481_07785 [Acidobacteriota bacterium]
MNGDRASRGRLLAPALLTLAFALWFFPAPYGAHSVGLDGSYAWAINAFDDTEARWGGDAAFTFGPLGWLLLPLDQGGHLVQGLAFWIGVHLLFVAVFARRAFHRPARAAAFAALLLASEVIGLGAGYRLLVLVVMLLAPEPVDPRQRSPFPGAVPLAATLTCVLILMRIHLGLAAALALAIHLLDERRWRPTGTALLVLGTGASVAFWRMFGGSLTDAWSWLGLQWELASGFSSAMALPASDGSLTAAGLVGLGAFAALALICGGRNRRVWLLLAPAMFFAFKHGFVRADGHVRIFFALLVVAAALGVLSSRPGASTALGAVALLLALPVVPIGDHRTVLGARGINALAALAELPERRQMLNRQSRRALNKRTLPGAVAGDLRAAGSVDVVPWELTYLPANDLPWRPQPVFQLYTAYTAELDHRTAGHFAGDSAPRHLLVHFDAIDRRHLLWDTPATWRTLLSHYRIARQVAEPNLLMLTRRNRPTALSDRLLAAGQLGSEWIPVPRSEPNEALFAELEFRPTVVGRLSAVLWRIPPVYLEMETADGETRRHRLLPRTAESGLLLPPPAERQQLAALWQGFSGPAVLRVRLTGPGVERYSLPVAVAWRAVPLS